jgi:NADH dehydrogenase/NADH:ubiquinone oxidoreductase subunit G
MMGATGRGNVMEIGTYVDKLLDTELSGNVIDLCPVGALTSKPFAFTARPWELIRHESIDVHDALGANIRVDTRGPEVMRILPRLNEEINEEWIGDKTRFAYDGLKRQRLDQPMTKGADGEFRPVQWVQAMELLAEKIRGAKGSEIHAVVGDLVDAEAIIAMKDLMNRLGSSHTRHVAETSTPLDSSTRASYLFNSRIVGIEDADLILLVGSNPRMESPVLAARIRKVVKQTLTPVFSVGPEADLAFEHTHAGNSSSVLTDLASGQAKGALANAFKAAKRPMVIVGMGALRGNGAQAVPAALDALRSAFPNLVTPEWNGVNILHTSASRVAALELGFTAGVNAGGQQQPKAKVVYLLGSEDVLDRSQFASDAFVVYQGHHGDAGAEQADLVLPAPAYTEKSGTYVSLEGRVQRTNTAVGRLANAREDWAILRALSEVLGKPLPYDTLEGVRERLAEVSPIFATYDTVEQSSFTPKAASSSSSSSSGAVTFQPFLSNYFMTDSISRASKTMAKASNALPTARNSYKNQQVTPAQQWGTQRGKDAPVEQRVNMNN